MTGYTVTLTCPDCGHGWDVHALVPGRGACAYRRCPCTEPRPVITPGERMAALREQVGTDELVSTAQDRATVQVGGKVFEKAPWERDSKLTRGGVVVEVYPTDTGEADVLCINGLYSHHGRVKVRTYRIDLSNCSDPEPRNTAVATRNARQLFEALSSRQSAAGPDLDRFEARYILWSLDLLGGLETITTIARTA